MIKIALIALLLAGCGGSGGGSSSGGSVTAASIETSCLANERNCSDADVDLNAPVRWAADNGIKIVHIRWAGCSDEASSKYAYERGVTIICIAGQDDKEVSSNSQYTTMIGSTPSNYGSGIDAVIFESGTIHSGIYATFLAIMDRPIIDASWDGYPERQEKSYKTVMIVDNGFDHRPVYVLHKNPMLAGQITGDYGIKALNELSLWVDVDVIGYVPFNTAPEVPRIDNWEII